MANPYQTPEGQLTDDDQAYGEIKFFSPSTRINRLRYWAHGMLLVLAFYPFMVIGLALTLGVSPMAGTAVLIVSYIFVIAGSFIIMIQRLHDLNKSGWMSLLALVPLANIYLFVLLIFFKGTQGRNDYGLQTPPNKTWHWIVALIMPIVAVIGMVAAIVLPAYQDYVTRAKAHQSSQQDAYPSEYSDEAAYPTEDSRYESPMDEVLPEENTDEESAIMDEMESETPQ